MKPVFPVALIAAAALLVGSAVFPVTRFLSFNRPPFHLDKLEQLEVGMSKTQVEQILGKPKSKDDAGWAYSRKLAWPTVYIYFDEEEGFSEAEYDY